MPNDTVPAAAEGLPIIDHAALICPPEKLAMLSMCDLWSFTQTLSAAQVLLAGSSMMNGEHVGSPACRMLEELSSLLICVMSDANRVARAHQPADAGEAKWRAWILLNHATVFSDDIADIAVLAATLTADLADRAERRQ